MILEWLESAPDATAKCLLARLLKENPDKYHQGQLRTLQRRVKQWRQLMAKKLVYDCLPDEFEAAAVSNGAKPGGQPPDPRNL